MPYTVSTVVVPPGRSSPRVFPGWNVCCASVRVADGAARFIQEKGSSSTKPFFLYVGWTLPHSPDADRSLREKAIEYTPAGKWKTSAALNGVTGLKPTYGRVSRWGMIAFASSLDQAGPLGLSAADCALMLQAMAGHDEKDSTCLNEPVDDYLGALDQSVDGLKIGVPEEFFPDNLDGAIADNAREAMRELEKQGAKLVKLSLPSIKLSVPAYYVIAPAEASSNLSRFDGVRFGYRCEDPKDLEDLYKRSRSEGFGAEVKRRILVGTYALSAGYYDAYYKRAQKVRRLIRDDFSRAFKDVDVIMGPTSPETAFKLGAKADDPVNMYMADVFTIAVNLAGLPALSMPSGFINGLPAGTQVIGNYFQEGRILNVAHRYQMATDWHQQAPGGFA